VSGVSLIAIYVRQDDLGYPPETILLWFLQTSLTLAAWRISFRQTLKWARARGLNSRRLAIAGTGELARHVANEIEKNVWMGFGIIGLFGDFEAAGRRQSNSEPRGSLEDLIELARRGEVDAIFVALSGSTDSSQVDSLIRKLSDSTASVYLMPDRRTRDNTGQQDPVESLPDRWRTDVLHRRLVDMGGIKAVSVYETPFLGVDGLLKRIEDIAVSSVALILFAIPMLVIALGVKLSSPGPIIFKQRRYGLDGKPIIVWKFRTMTVCEDAGAVTQARKTDPRVTSFGRFLRRSSLDELPQFINVLQGSMSIVGPRPHAVIHNEYYRGLIGGYMLRHKVKPGITGWAQVHGWRGETDSLEKMGRRVDFDLDYIRNWSLWLDIQIILMTFFSGFVHRNAY
jgi:putative colanic acid biosynthesis UDP-glucose lipid carrier transferase